MKFINSMLGLEASAYLPVTKAAEAAGFDLVSLSDHVFLPEELNTPYPYTADGKPVFRRDEQWPDPWVMIGLLSGATSTIKFITNVYILPARNPFVTAKAVGTAAYLSNNRVILGVGAGWMEEEFIQMEQDFASRGKRMEEAITVLRTLWQGGMVSHSGTYYNFPRLEVSPAPTQQVPIYVGGKSKWAFRRTARFGDGWMGMMHSIDELRDICETLQREREDAGRADEPFDIIAAPLAMPSPDVLEEIESFGVTGILTSPWMIKGLQTCEADQACELVAEYGERFIAPVRK